MATRRVEFDNPPASPDWGAYEARIAELIEAGRDEGISPSDASIDSFRAFVTSAGYARNAGLALMDNGNLRAVWKGADGAHLGLHFLGDSTVNYVIFKRRPGSTHISRVSGNDSFAGVQEQVRAFGLESLVYA